MSRFSPFNRAPFILIIGMLFSLQPVEAQKKRSKGKPAPPMEFVLADAGATSYRIILPGSPTESESKAASVLQDYMLQISGAALPIVSSRIPPAPFEIILGQNERLNALNTGISLNTLEEDGFLIRTDSMRLIIAGGSEKGTLYGVYTFLEKYLGCRMYSPRVKVIPKQERIALGPINDLEVPKIKFRDTHYKVTWDAEYTDWHKLDHDEQGRRTEWGMWVHTFNALVPPATYAKDHPEYYALVEGKRTPTQLCLTNPDVFKITIESLRRMIAEHPEAKYWSVSQNDNRQYCTCPRCTAINEREGSPSGSIIAFVNQVADQFPDKMISTLAYEYSRKAPLNIRPRDNVNIMLCSIEAYRDKPIVADTASADFVRDVEEWGKIAKDIIVWDYVIQFNNLLAPFPNLHVLQPNIQFFAEHGVTAMFEQGNREVGGEFAELRAYMISKLLWDPYLNVDSLMNDFLDGYYGPAGKPIREYIDKMRLALQYSGLPLGIFTGPNDEVNSFLTPALLKRYQELFDEAEAAVASTPDTLERVRIARLPVQFAIMEQAKKSYRGENGLFVNDGGIWKVRPAIRTMIDPFVDLCIRQGVTRVKEWSTTPEAYRAAMYRLFTLGMKEHLAYGKSVTLKSPVDIPDSVANILTDGIRGSHDPAYNWFVFSGQDLDAVIDLGSVRKVSHMESAYYQLAAWLRIMPLQVEYFVSDDGEHFDRVASISNDLPIDQYDAFQRDFIADFEPRDARYVRVMAHTIGNTPQDHPGAGRPARMLVDEIVVE